MPLRKSEPQRKSYLFTEQLSYTKIEKTQNNHSRDKPNINMHHSKVPWELSFHMLMGHFWPSISFWKHWLDGMGAYRKRRTSTGSVSDPEAAFVQEFLLAPFDHAQSCSSSSGNLGNYERYSKGHNYSLDIWISCPVGKISAVLISDLKACLGVLLFMYTSNGWVAVIIIVYN